MTDARLAAPRGLSRRQLLKLGAVSAVAVAVGGTLDELATIIPRPPSVRAPLPTPPQRRAFLSRPDLTPPVVSVAMRRAQLPAGLVLLTPGNGAKPDGLLIATTTGEPVWIHPVPGKEVADLRVASYRGEPVLTWWEGDIEHGYGYGEYVVVDASYREITRVHAANGLEADLHEFLIGPEGTAFLLTSRVVQGSLPASGGAVSGPLQEGVVQEVEPDTGRVLFEWHSLDHIDPAESYQPVPTDGSTYDYLHLNSIELDGQGGLLLSARHTWAVYRIDRSTGDVTWRLNGKRSDFGVPQEAQFAWQHDARLHPDGTVSIFDDGASGPPPQFESRSRGIVLAIDPAARKVRLVKRFVHPDGILAASQGSLQLLPNGGAFVGWGSVPRFTAFGPNGGVQLDGSFGAASQSYRAYLQPWVGRPADVPAVAIEHGTPEATLHVSWNGATDVARWELLDPYAEIGSPAVSVAPVGFETAVSVPSALRRVVVRALDRGGREMARTDAFSLT